MKQATIFIIFFLIATFTMLAQTIELVGKQTINKEDSTASLACVPVKISKSMKISEVMGSCDGFWVEKGSVTIYKFSNFDDAVGTILAPGTYYVYPNIKKDNKKADVTITLDPLVK